MAECCASLKGNSAIFQIYQTKVFGRSESLTVSPTGLTDADFERGRNVVPSSNVDASLTQGDYELPQGISKMKSSDRQRNALKSEARRWDNGSVPYVVDANFTDAEKANIAWAMNQIMNQSCVTFMPKAETDTDYVEIVDIGYCWSILGKNGGMQQIKLGGCKDSPGSILHELMHVLGFYHEHERNDRDNWVRIFFNNIRLGHKNEFEKQSLDNITHLGTEYDYGSIMHYSEFAFAVRFAPTIFAIRPIPPGVKIGQRERLSKKDVRKINVLYKCYNDSEGYFSDPVPQPVTTTKEPVIEVATTTTLVPECVDHDERCTTSYKKYCTYWSEYMRTWARRKCPKTCHVEEICGPSTAEPIVRECVDLDERCSILFEDYCTSENEYSRGLVMNKCPKTCHNEEICGPSVVKPTKAPIDPESKCVDLDERCPTQIKEYCNSKVKNIRITARRKCPKTCQVEESCGSTEAPIG